MTSPLSLTQWTVSGSTSTPRTACRSFRRPSSVTTVAATRRHWPTIAPPHQKTIYHLEVLILVDLADEQEAYEELEKYISADSSSSVKSLMEAVGTAGVQVVECSRAESRRRYDFGGASIWGCIFWVRNIVT